MTHNHHPEFIAGLSLRREEVWGVGIDRLRSLLPKALGVLERALEADPDPFVLKRGVPLHTGGAVSTVSS